MGKKDILLVSEMVANEKNVDVFNAIETALATVIASRVGKELGEDIDIRVSMNRRTGDYEVFRRWLITADEQMIHESVSKVVRNNQMLLTKAKMYDASLKVGDRFEQKIDSIPFSRIDAQAAKRIIQEEFRKAERIKLANIYKARIGEVLTGVVQRVMREGILLKLEDKEEKIEAFLPREQMIPREEVRLYDRLLVYLEDVKLQTRGPQLIVSRTTPELLVALFKLKVLEVDAGVIEIKAIVRDPGSRAKVAVKTNDGRIDPVGMCVGMKGERVQAISHALHGESIDIILWDENPARLAINAIAPAEVTSIVMNEATRVMDIAVSAEYLSRAIGRNGQNVRLASKLVGWGINVMTIEDAKQKHLEDAHKLEHLFMEQLEIDAEFAKTLVKSGFTSLEEIAYISDADLLEIQGLDFVQFEELRQYVKDLLLVQALSLETDGDTPSDNDPLETVEGVHPMLALQLIKHGITTREGLAELSVDDLLDLIQIERAAAEKLIITARAHWFKSS